MDRNIDYRMQNVFRNAAGSNGQERQATSFSYARDETTSTDWSFGPAPRQSVPVQEPMSFDIHGRAPLNTSQHSLPAPTLGPGRISLPSRNIYNQQGREPRTISNADNHFRVAQNLRQGAPINQPTPEPTIPRPLDTIPQYSHNMAFQKGENHVKVSPIGQIANAMLLDLPIPPRQILHQIPDSEPSTFWQQNMYRNRVGHLQPQRQQISPPFNLSGFTYSLNTQQDTRSSSPAADEASSPTARISLRRTTNRAPPSDDYPEAADDYEEEMPAQQTPQRHSLPSFKRPSQAIALGHAPHTVHGIQLVSPHELPDRFRQVFQYELFNAAQSKCFAPIYKTNDNVVVSAPTASGKTAILELAICKLVEGHRSGEFKIVYQAPTKSLCSERLRDWEKKFSHLNLPCAELTGDTSQKEMTKVRNASIIVTTPEKWDSITRKWSDHHKLVQMVKLFLIDEVHILKDTRGATLEAVVSRMKTMGADVRFVALSATIPNSHDIAVWLGKDRTNHQFPAHRETFGEDFRPVKLQKHVHGFDGQMNDFAFEKVLDGKIPSLIQKYTHKKPMMIFCFTRKSCESTAALLAEWWMRQRVIDRAWPAPAHKVAVGSKQLQELVGCGVAFHHAGLESQDRLTIEIGYLKGDISLICCTSTLAVGVNLPCHLVVLKGTVGYQDGILGEYSDLEVMQMLGRAGRPQFDDSAVAVIMTRSDKLDRYKKMISGQEMLESTLHLNLIEHLNSEIGLGTVHSVDSAKRWLTGTFLSVRMRQNPSYYKIEGVPPNRDTDHRLELVCERGIKLLQDYQLITIAERFSCTEYGQAMSRYMVAFETMKLLLSIPKHAKMEQILNTICQAAEFKDLRMKPSERPHLREFNKSPFIKYTIKDNVSTTAHKISLIVQVQLGGIEYPSDKDFNMVRRQFGIDKSIVFDRINRLIRCVIDCKSHDCDAISTRNALDLARSLSAEFWESSNLQLRQIPGVGPAAIRKMAASNINSVEKLAGMTTAEIERYMSKNPPYGRKLLDQLSGFPRLKLGTMIMARTVKAGVKPRVSVTAILGYDNEKVPVWRNKKPTLTFTAETADGTLVHFWRGNVSRLEGGYEIKFTAELSVPGVDIKCYIACEEIVGTMRSSFLKHEISASAFPPPNEDNVQKQVPSKQPRAEDSDEFGEEDVQDDELLAAVRDVDASKDGYGSDEFADVDEFEDENPNRDTKNYKAITVVVSAQMANGKWTCNHSCSDGKILKNGQTCKHRCCTEGLDKPRKVRTKSTASANTQKAPDSQMGDGVTVKKSLGKNSQAKGTSSRASKSKVNKGTSKLKLKKDADSDQDSVELVDLADEFPPVPYANLAPRDYRKLHTLHTSVQEDKTVRLPKRTPQFSYKSGENPAPPFLHNEEKADDDFEDGGIDDDDLPSPSKLFPRHNNHNEFDYFSPDAIAYQPEVPTTSFFDESIESLEAGMIGTYDSMALRQPTSKVNSSLFNDFNAFSALNSSPTKLATPKVPMKNCITPSPLSRGLQKRERISSPETKEMKHRRVSKEENGKLSAPTSSFTPSWVDEFDAELIDGLKGFVDFVD